MVVVFNITSWERLYTLVSEKPEVAFLCVFVRCEVHSQVTLTLDSDDDFRSGCRNVSQCHPKPSFLGLHSPGRS